MHLSFPGLGSRGIEGDRTMHVASYLMFVWLNEAFFIKCPQNAEAYVSRVLPRDKVEHIRCPLECAKMSCEDLPRQNRLRIRYGLPTQLRHERIDTIAIRKSVNRWAYAAEEDRVDALSCTSEQYLFAPFKCFKAM